MILEPIFSMLDQAYNAVHRGAFCQFIFRWIYYCHSSKSTGKETGKMHLCAVAVGNSSILYVHQIKNLSNCSMASLR